MFDWSPGRWRRGDAWSAASLPVHRAVPCFAALCLTAFLDVGIVQAQSYSDDGSARWSGGLTLYGGDLDGDALASTEAYFAIPFGEHYQFQFDAEVGASEGNVFGGGMARFYWRDPDRGMFGGGFAETHRNVRGYDDIFQLFAEGAWYPDEDWTIYGQAGVQMLFNKSNSFFEDDPRFVASEADEQHSPFARLGVTYYPSDVLSLSADINGSDEGNAYAVVSGAYDMSDLWHVTDFLLLADTHLSLEQVSARIGIKVEFGVDGLTLAGRDRAARLPVRVYDQAFVLENAWQIND